LLDLLDLLEEGAVRGAFLSFQHELVRSVANAWKPRLPGFKVQSSKPDTPRRNAMTANFNNRSVFNAITENMTLIVMAGMTLLSAAVWASQPEQVVHHLPGVVITQHGATEVAQLPRVVVVGKRVQ
jgi:hypothetical protein